MPPNTSSTNNPKSVYLPDAPKGLDVEDFIAAALQASGHFVEKNIEDQDVLELDIVATSYLSAQPSQKLYEVKSGGWGFKDIFRTVGQMQYLGIREGMFVTSAVGDQSTEFYNEKCRDLDISIHVLDGFEAPPNLTGVSVGGEAHSMWRWSFWLERILVRRLTLICKTDPKLICPRIVRDYYRLINNEIFFVPQTSGAVGRLYDAYKDHPSLTLDAAAEIEGNYPDPTGEAGRDTVKAALNDGEHLLLQICM